MDPKKHPQQRSIAAILLLVVNIALLAGIFVLYSRYINAYDEGLRKENLENIANLNESAAINAISLIDSWSLKLSDIAQYTDRHGLTLEQALRLLEDSNSSAKRYFELVDANYCGYLARRDDDGKFIPISYQGSSYADIQDCLDDVKDIGGKNVRVVPEFTESYSALKCFAVYRHVSLLNDLGKPETYTLLLAGESRDVLAVFNAQTEFNGQSTVLIDSNGNYIVSNSDFKSTNLFHYLYVYNDLTLDQRNKIHHQVLMRGSGELYYKNGAGADCVFRYAKMTANDWYCVTCVPLDSFRTPVFSINYAVYAVIGLLLLLALDVLWLRYMNRRLRLSMLKEKEASDAKTDFLSRMSHDIRTPLNGIIGLTTLAQDENNPPLTQEYLDKINLSGQFLAGLVNDILDLSKVESGKVELHLEPYSSRDLYKYVSAVIQPLCRDKGIQFCMNDPDDNPPVMLDRLRFNQIMFNLLSNAVKYTNSGGLIELYWKSTPISAQRVALQFTIRDTGIGMSEEFQQHMFESFSQEQNQTAQTGSGLGLAIVRSLVRLMHGKIEVVSKKGAGSTFTVFLETDLCEQKVAAPENGPAVLDGRRVLLCEDNYINTLVVQRLLEKWGVTVHTAENGRIGVEMFSASVPDFYDAILMDVMMPEMNGLDATRTIRAMDRPDATTVPILAMTANAYDSDVTNCLSAGMNAHMGKPIDTEQLRTMLSAYIVDQG